MHVCVYACVCHLGRMYARICMDTFPMHTHGHFIPNACGRLCALMSVHACMHACRHVCTFSHYACMHACRYPCTCMYARMHIWPICLSSPCHLHEKIFILKFVCVCVCVYLCTSVHVFYLLTAKRGHSSSILHA
jgi:hypothetical protein